MHKNEQIETKSNIDESCTEQREAEKSSPLSNGYFHYDNKSAAEANMMEANIIFDLSEDTTNDTELSDEAVQFVGTLDFGTHRSPLRDSHSSRSSTTDNIFLQEPVLTLNVDKSPNQASSIKINKSLEIEPIFSSPPSAAVALTAANLNGRFNQIVSLNTSFEQHSPNKCAAPAFAVIPDNDNSSCDSGVALGSSLESTANAATATSAAAMVQSPLGELTASGRRRKPATPHRILCPSPIKSSSRMLSPGNTVTASSGVGLRSPSARKAALAKNEISPRKSQRNHAAVASKTRRRLNHREQAPYTTANSALNGNAVLSNGTASSSGDDETMTNGCMQVS